MRFLFLIFILFFSLNTRAQFFEIGGLGGVVSFNGDVNEGDLFTNSQAMFGAFIRYSFNPRISLKFNFIKGTLEARDRSSQQAHIRERNLSFRSDLMEFGLTAEVGLFPFVPDKTGKVFSPYAFLGIGLITFNPMAKYQGDWVELQPIGTEGQGIDGYGPRYGLISAVVPLGLGFKYAISKRIIIGIEVGYRLSFTDYLDDVSTLYLSPKILNQNGALAVVLSNRTEEYTGAPADDLIGERRGNANNNDGYLIWGITASFALHGKKAFKKEEKTPYKINKWF